MRYYLNCKNNFAHFTKSKNLNMNSENEKKKQETDQKINEAIEKAVENAEARKELSDEELDGIDGGAIAGGLIRTTGFVGD